MRERDSDLPIEISDEFMIAETAIGTFGEKQRLIVSLDIPWQTIIFRRVTNQGERGDFLSMTAEEARVLRDLLSAALARSRAGHA